MLKQSIDEITKDELIKVIISNKKDKQEKYNKISIVLKENKNKKYYQIEKFTDKQVFHENIEINELNEKILEIIKNYKQLNAMSLSFNYDLKISKKGKVFLGKKRSDNKNIKNISHNKEKNYILKEGSIIKPLIDLGIFTKEGKIINQQYNKFKQINRFIEMVDDEVRKSNLDEMTILDFGCGKSYLTFVLYHYFVEIKKMKIKMIGLDLKEDVIKNCNDIAKKYGYTDLHFEIGDINGYKFNDKVDMVITLHACNTATDYALYNAIKWNTKMIFSVPCCQHEFNSQIKSDDYSLFTKYGLIKERISSLMTDATRASLLEYLGYKVQVLEFIDMAHSPKNILIRASKSNIPKEKKEKSLQEVKNIMKEFNVSPTLYNLLKNDNYIK